MEKTDPDTFLPLPAADFHILLALRTDPLHGYGIMKSVEETSGTRVRIEVGSLYRKIGKLLSRGLLRKVPNPDKRPRPGQPRQSYALTELGGEVLRAEAHRLRDTLALISIQELLTEGSAP